MVEDFARASLVKLNPTERGTISGQLRQLYRTSIDWRARGGAVGAFGFAVGGPTTRALSVGQLGALQKTIGEMLERLVDGTRGEVAIPHVPMFIYRMTPALRRPAKGSRHSRQPSRFQIRGQTNRERDAILVGFLELVRIAGGQLYACPGCGRPFVANGRQEYCLKTCSQQVRTARWREADAQREYDRTFRAQPRGSA
jgi:hypothetical protein